MFTIIICCCLYIYFTSSIQQTVYLKYCEYNLFQSLLIIVETSEIHDFFTSFLSSFFVCIFLAVSVGGNGRYEMLSEQKKASPPLSEWSKYFLKYIYCRGEG